MYVETMKLTTSVENEIKRTHVKILLQNLFLAKLVQNAVPRFNAIGAHGLHDTRAQRSLGSSSGFIFERHHRPTLFMSTLLLRLVFLNQRSNGISSLDVFGLGSRNTHHALFNLQRLQTAPKAIIRTNLTHH